MAKSPGKMLVVMIGGKGACKPRGKEEESDDMEDDDEEEGPMKMAKGGMVVQPYGKNKPVKKLAKTPIQIKGWGKARKG